VSTKRRSYGYEEEIGAREEGSQGSQEVAREEKEGDEEARAESRGTPHVGAPARSTESGQKKADCEVGSEKSSQEETRCPSSAPRFGSSIGPTRRGDSRSGNAQSGSRPGRLAVPCREPVITPSRRSDGSWSRLAAGGILRTDSRVSTIQNPGPRGKAQTGFAPQHNFFIL
jgi:hypothetical protein